MEPVPGLSPDQQFWIAVMDRAIPIALEVLKILGILAAAWAAGMTLRKQTRNEEQLRQVHEQLDGRMGELKDAIGNAARAEGKVEGFKEGIDTAVATTPPPPATVILQPLVGTPIPGGKRAGDPPAEPPAAGSVPVEVVNEKSVKVETEDARDGDNPA